MVDIIVLIVTGIAFLALVAAVPLALLEARRDEHDAHVKH